jgi:hypothetical protein
MNSEFIMSVKGFVGQAPGPYAIKIMAVVYECLQYDRVFAPSTPFQPCNLV